MTFTNKVALITGATSGIGKATARLFAEQGAKVALLGQNQKKLEQTVAEFKQAGLAAFPILADVSQDQQVRQGIEQAAAQWGRLDIVFANAGINGVWAPLEELTAEDWQQTLEVNLKGTFLTIKHALPSLKKQGGSIIITSSVNGTRMFSNTGATAYACSKAAQVALAKMAALELAKNHIRVNVICPGYIETNIEQSTQQKHLDAIREPVEFPAGAIPLTDGAPGTSEQVAQLVLFLASDAASHITGTEIWIDGGQSLLQG